MAVGAELIGTIDEVARAVGDARYVASALGPLDGFFAREARAAAMRVNVLMVGDSIMEGAGAPTVADRWVDQAQARLRSAFGPAAQGRGYIPAQYAATAASGSPFPAWTYTGSAPNTPHGIDYKAKQLNGATSAATITVNCSSFRLFFARNAADAVTITIDGGAPVTFTMNTSIVAQFWDSPALTPGNHTITVTRSAGGPSFCGGYFYNGDESAGIALWDGSHSGGKMSDLDTGSPDWFNHLPLIAPALIVLGCGTNDSRTVSG